MLAANNVTKQVCGYRDVSVAVAAAFSVHATNRSEYCWMTVAISFIRHAMNAYCARAVALAMRLNTAPHVIFASALSQLLRDPSLNTRMGHS